MEGGLGGPRSGAHHGPLRAERHALHRALPRSVAHVRAYVERVLGEEEDPRVWMDEPIVDGDRAAISWWASLREQDADTTLAGTSVLRFNADGLVVEQWDAWYQLDTRRD